MEYFHGIIIVLIKEKSIIINWYLKKWEGAESFLAHTGTRNEKLDKP